MGYTTTAKVANAARNIEISSGKTATMTENEANQFIDESDSIINSKLSAVFYTPLRQITRGSPSVTDFPAPIVFIATRLAAALMIRSVYSRIDPVLSENANSHFQDALRDLDELSNGILVGSRRLDGQTLKARNFFVNPNVAPLEPPKEQRV